MKLHFLNGWKAAAGEDVEMTNLSLSTWRQFRLISALLSGPKSRKDLTSPVGAQNVPQIVFELRAKGFKILCERVMVKDRDGIDCVSGVYHLSETQVEEAKKLIEGWRCGNTSNQKLPTISTAIMKGQK